MHTPLGTTVTSDYNELRLREHILLELLGYWEPMAETQVL